MQDCRRSPRRSTFILEKQNFAISDVDKVLVLTSGLPNTYAPLISLDSIPPEQLTQFETDLEARQKHEENEAYAVTYPPGHKAIRVAARDGAGLAAIAVEVGITAMTASRTRRRC
ncbi:hypothetical protein GGX14DRAFT_351841 [Mycena pura]|uniref:Uncharacterized protein n=1 Tax=Mycena pura TaxID=153505 RepID=A0AAD7E160_9AGAR|nr:hypothetical protein GGX14DRAFT_351841 [Mycena pura]